MNNQQSEVKPLKKEDSGFARLLAEKCLEKDAEIAKLQSEISLFESFVVYKNLISDFESFSGQSEASPSVYCWALANNFNFSPFNSID